MDQQGISDAERQQEVSTSASRIIKMVQVEDATKAILQEHQENSSTATSDLQEHTELRDTRPPFGPESQTDPTSQPSEASEQNFKEAFESDEADCGSEFIRSATESSLTSDNSTKALPIPTTDDRVEGVGSHLSDSTVSSTDLAFDPGNLHEAHSVFSRVASASGAIMDFDNNVPPQPSRLDATFSISVQAPPVTLDVEQQPHNEAARDSIREYTWTVVIIMLIFIALSFGYYSLTMVN